MGIDIPSRDLENVFPYARLACMNVDEGALQNVSEVFSLKIIPGHDKSIFFLTAKEPIPGEHKLHTLTLLAAALILNQKQPKAKLSLNLQRDFMKDSLPLRENHLQEFVNIPEGSLKISSPRSEEHTSEHQSH